MRGPDQPYRVRHNHRTWLSAHFALLVVGLGGAFLANRFLTPETFWAHWVALGWGAAFAAHLVVFSRETLASMSAKARQARRQG